MKNYLKKRYALTEQGSENLVKGTLYCFLTYVIDIGPMIVLMMMVDQLLGNGYQSPFVYVAVSLAILIVMYFLLSKEYVNLYNSTYKESANLRKDLAKTLSELPLAYFSDHDLSDLSQTIMSDVDRIEHAMAHGIPKVLAMWMFFPIMGILMAYGNIKLAVAAVAPALLSFLFEFLGHKFQVAQNRKYYKTLRENSELFQETIELQQEISSFDQSDKVKSRLYRKMEESEAIHWKVELSSMILVSIGRFLSFLSLAIVILLGIRLMLAGEVTLIYVIGYIIGAMKIKELFDISEMFYFEMLYIEPAVERIRELKATPVQKGEETKLENYNIRFNNVTFSYKDGIQVLNGVSFVAGQGQVTALVGPSGSGKTSVLRVLSRLYDYDGGEITIDGKDIKNIGTDGLFKAVSVVFQDVTLFNTTVMENIRLGRYDASDEEVMEAAKQANCFDFINKLPEGFYTKIGENGAELSGGERQRLSIARAFLKDAPILILDEISASLDVDNEKKIQESLNKLIKNKTVLIISHRMKSIEKVDQIVVIDNGKVEACGAHQQLLETSKTYRNLIEKTKLAEAFTY